MCRVPGRPLVNDDQCVSCVLLCVVRFALFVFLFVCLLRWKGRQVQAQVQVADHLTTHSTLQRGGEENKVSDRHFDLSTDRTRLIGSSPPQGQSHNGCYRPDILGPDRKLLLQSCSGIRYLLSSRPVTLVPSQTSLFRLSYFLSPQGEGKAGWPLSVRSSPVRLQCCNVAML